MFICSRSQNLAKGCESSSHCHGIGVVRAAMEYPMTRNQIHDLAPRAECSQRKSAADRFGEANDVGFHIEILARTAASEFGSGLHFVEYQERAMLLGDF